MIKHKFLYLLIIFLVSLSLGICQSQLGISGYIDASVALPIEDDIDLGFSFDCLEINLTKEIAEGISLRADIDFFPNWEDELIIFDDEVPIDTVTNSIDGFVFVEQAFMTYRGLTFGKFNAPIGFEGADAPDMFQYSHSLVFDNAIPGNLTGFSYFRDLGVGLDVIAYAVNGWDVNYADDDELIYGGRLGYNGIDGIGIGLSAIQLNADTVVFDIDGSITKINNLTLGFEYNTGGTEDGWLIMANYSICNFGLTLRQDAWGEHESTTISPSFSIAEGAGMLFEYRIDKDPDGNEIKSSAVEFTFSF